MSNLSRWKIACAVFVFFVVTVVAANAQVFTTLVDFLGPNGYYPYLMSMVQGRDGNAYGTTYYGGVNNYGTFFKMTPGGDLTVLYSFDNTAAYPVAGLILGTDGNFYGTTIEGGANGYGAVFRITARGVLTVLHSFNITDGSTPYAPVVQGVDGNFYGTTLYGGSVTYDCSHGCGTVFKMTPTGALTTLHSFEGYQDGGLPWAGLVEASNGDFYGTTSGGGVNYDGTVFKISPAGEFTTLHAFQSTDGLEPTGTLVRAQSDLYGTTTGGGANGYGTIFKMTRRGALSTLYSFCSIQYCPDGRGPVAGMIEATDGNFYGTTVYGGSDGGYGTVYEFGSGGGLTTLQSFDLSTTGGVLEGGLLQATNGTFYGATTVGGSTSGSGTIFSLDMGLGPFVTFVRAAGKVGQTGGILGQGFTGTTNVALNGIPAGFTVKSDTYITATVPVGATTGYVTVTTPSGTLTSNVPFYVIP